jgi:hypothetical protein
MGRKLLNRFIIPCSLRIRVQIGFIVLSNTHMELDRENTKKMNLDTSIQYPH